MAALIRCSSFFPRPCAVRSPPSDQFSGKSCAPGNWPIPLFSSFGNLPVIKPGCSHLMPGTKHVYARLEEHEKKSKENLEILITPFAPTKFSDKLLAFEVSRELKSPSMVVLVINALMMAAPLEALAETCESKSSFFNMPLLSFVALIGATVGGLLARQRKGELQRLNEQLRQINTALKRQAKIESYAPALSYAPVGARIPESEVIVDPRKQDLISKLKTGKNFLRNQELEKAFAGFRTALELAQNLKDPIEEKKAARGLGASLQRQGKYREAIQYHSMVLAISEREGEDSGNTEAYGAIADCYTELGDLDRAGVFYDKYIARLETD